MSPRCCNLHRGDFHRPVALAINHTVSSKVPKSLVVSHTNLFTLCFAVLSSFGVRSLFSRVVISCLNIVSDQQPGGHVQLNIIQQHSASGTIIDTTKWMTVNLLLSLANRNFALCFESQCRGHVRTHNHSGEPLTFLWCCKKLSQHVQNHRCVRCSEPS